VDLALLLNARELTHEAVEVGTDRGVFARQFLSVWKGELLLCVDAYKPYPEMPWDRMGDLLLASANLAPFASRCRLVMADSVEAAATLHRPNEFDFVYIDAAHNYESVRQDIAAWWPRIHGGGYLAGHDYDIPGVKEAVREHIERIGIPAEITSDFYSPSWFMQKR